MKNERLASGRAKIARYVEMRPMTDFANGSAEPVRVSSIFNLLKFKPMFAILMAVAVALAGSGTVAASQNDLPGDALYNVKLVSENVREALAFSNIKKVELKAESVAQRASELVELTKREGSPSPKAVEQAAKRYEKLLKQLSDVTSKLNAKDKMAVTPEVLSAINSAEADLAQVNATSSSSTINEMVSTTLATELEITEQEEEAAEKEPSLVGLKNRAENKISQVSKKIGDLKNVVASVSSSTLSSSTLDKVALAETMLVDAQAKFASGTYAEAFTLAKDAQKAAIDAKRAFLIEKHEGAKVERDAKKELRAEALEESKNVREEIKNERKEKIVEERSKGRAGNESAREQE